ncbi:hypothetical protein FNH22_29980 [Fulvivirga sp. M361]|uniref:hypothetical protein n=1 Tax=Fulvivirga sp. M361 TaxID=2594266 RepID=UPI0011799CE8|nr:hypothetical protein [Fulvivirga sp. M361]TRX48002.1 hypothetical protein FNH22_29980 [Fulvivirga sp. M361]
MYRILMPLIVSIIFFGISSCSDDDDEPGKLDSLNASSWLGEVEIEELDYDSNNSLIRQEIYTTDEGLFNLIVLNDDKTALIKYQCDKTECNGNEYNGKWELIHNTLKVVINREELNALSDLIVIEGDIVQISAPELIIEVVFDAPSTSVAKRVRRLKYISVG